MVRLSSLYMAVSLFFGFCTTGHAASAMRLGPFVHAPYQLVGVPIKLNTQVDVSQIKVDGNVNLQVKSLTDLSSIKQNISKIINKIASPESRKFKNDTISFEIYLSNIDIIATNGTTSVKANGSLIEPKFWVAIPGALTRFLSGSDTTSPVTTTNVDPRPTIKNAFTIEVPLDFKLKDDGSIDFIIARPTIKVNETINYMAGMYKYFAGSDINKLIEDRLEEKISTTQNFTVPMINKYQLSMTDRKIYIVKKKLYLEMKISAIAGSADINPLIATFLASSQTATTVAATPTTAPPAKQMVRVKLDNSSR